MKLTDYIKLSEDRIKNSVSESMKKKIDAMSYEEMVEAYKSSTPEDLMFRVPIGEYFATVLESKRMKAIKKKGRKYAIKDTGVDGQGQPCDLGWK